MDRILKGIVKFRGTAVRRDLVEQFKNVSDHPKPTAVFFTCMDSRMLPTRFTQSQVGDMFVVRNGGNMVPEAVNYGNLFSLFFWSHKKILGHTAEVSVTTEPAALELAVKRGGIRHVIVCGHSDCKAMNLLYNLHQCPKNFDIHSPMDHWVRKNGFRSIKRLNERLHHGPKFMKFEGDTAPSQNFEAVIDPFDRLPAEDKLSQINVLQQMMNVASHRFLEEYFESGRLFLHAMWFDVYKGEDYLFSRDKKRFVLIDEDTVDDLKAEVARRCGDDNQFPGLEELDQRVVNS